jgi:alpha-1,2-rhamnosyltransferase
MTYFTLQQSGVKVVPMLHDLLPVSIPDKYEQVWSRCFHYNVYATCMLADAVVCISHATRNDLERLMESHSYRLQKIFVQHHGFDFNKVRKTPVSLNRFPADTKYFIMVGSIEPKKNHSIVIEQFLNIARFRPDIRLKIIGFSGWMQEEITKKINSVVEEGFPVDYYKDVDDAELALAYTNALATIMASSHEGFGLPIIEGLSLGCPLILSDIPVFREIAGDSGIYFSLDEPSSLGDAMLQCLDVEASRRIEDFTWPNWDEQASVLFDYLVSLKAPHRTVYGEMTRGSVSELPP